MEARPPDVPAVDTPRGAQASAGAPTATGDRSAIDRRSRSSNTRRSERLPAPGRQRAEWGGTLVGAALLGWLAAAGASILLTDFVVAAGTAVGLGVPGTHNAEGSPDGPPMSAPMGFTGAVSLFAIHFLAYTAGGYVAGRISRFSGALQGFVVWVCSVVVAIVIAALAATAGAQYNVLARLNIFPRMPLAEGHLTEATAISVVLVVIVALVGSVIGGVLGNEFYRRAARRGAHY